MTTSVLPHAEIVADEDQAFRAAVRDGMASAEAGQMIPFAQMRVWLESWGKPEELPAPQPQ